MSQSTGYIFAFAAGVCVVCSLALATTKQLLVERQDLNVLRDGQKNVLTALGLPEDGHALAGEEVDQMYANRVQVTVVDTQGNVIEGKDLDDVKAARLEVKGTDQDPSLMAVYQRLDDGKVVGYAIEMYGVGLWGPISGYLALNPDGETVSGATFAAPKETPGLGYEITQPRFREQWSGKRIHDGSSPKPIAVQKSGMSAVLCPGEASDFCVDGVSGATITGNGVNDMVAEAVTVYEPYLSNIRAGATQ